MCKAPGNDEEGQQVNHKKRSGTDYKDLAPIPFFETAELKLWRFYKAVIAEFVASFLFLYVSVATIIGHDKGTDQCDGVGVLGIAMAVGGMIFILVYCTAGMSGGHINPAVTFAMLVSRRVSLLKAVAYLVAQCLGGICGVGLVKALMKHSYVTRGGGANFVAPDFSKGAALGAEIVGTFVLVFTVMIASDAKRRARDKPVDVLLPLPIGFAVFVVHLATIPITGTGINPARSFAAAVVYNNRKVWDDQWIFWVGPYLGALIAAVYNNHVLRASNGIKQKTTVPL